MKIRHLNIEVTKRCNQRCFYCFNNSGIGAAASELSPESWLAILHNLKEQGLVSMHLTGGEPFAYSRAIELLAGAQELGLETSILSNGLKIQLLVKQHPAVFRRLTLAQISLDSMNPDVHNRRRGYDEAWNDAMNAIQSLRSLDVPVEISCVVSDENLNGLRAVAEFCRNIGASLILRPMIAVGRAAGSPNSAHFTQSLTTCVGELQEIAGLKIVPDRFHYVPAKRAPVPNDIYTAHQDGLFRFNGVALNRQSSLLELAA